VAELPEEKVRQNLIRLMTGKLGFPARSLVVEKAIRQFPHLSQTPEVPDCRIDIASFVKGIHPDHELFPLIVIECKAVSLTPRVLRQVAGYNYYLQAPFVAVANQSGIRTGWYDPGKNEYQYIETLPSHSELLSSLPL
jgi:hypothetical protein